LDWVAQQLDMNDKGDSWYDVSVETIEKLGGGPMLSHYNGYLHKAIPQIYPEIQYVVWRFKDIPENFWEDSSKRSEFFSWISKHLKIEKNIDWYRVSKEVFFQSSMKSCSNTLYRI
jgi:hypothetical protein